MHLTPSLNVYQVRHCVGRCYEAQNFQPSFLLSCGSQQPRTEAIDYKLSGVIQQHGYKSQVSKIEEIKR